MKVPLSDVLTQRYQYSADYHYWDNSYQRPPEVHGVYEYEWDEAWSGEGCKGL